MFVFNCKIIDARLVKKNLKQHFLQHKYKMGHVKRKIKNRLAFSKR